MVFGYLALGIGLSLWFAELTRNKLVQAARWGLGVLAIAAILADLPTFASVVVPPKPKPIQWKPAVAVAQLPNQLPAFFTNGSYRKYLKPGENVVIVSHRGNAGMLFQAYTDFYFNIDGGFINASLSRPDALPQTVALLSHLPGEEGRLRVERFKAYLKSAKIGAVIVERDWSEDWMYVFGKIGMKGTNVGGVTLYTIPHKGK
jgi:hypothetical protein